MFINLKIDIKTRIIFIQEERDNLSSPTQDTEFLVKNFFSKEKSIIR